MSRLSSLCRFNPLVLIFTGSSIILLYAIQLLQFQCQLPPSCHQLGPRFIDSQSTGSNRVSNMNCGVCAESVPPAIHWSRGRYDNQRMIRIYEWIWTGSQWDELTQRFDVCLATMSSLDRLFSIAEVSEKWLGPISLAVYIQVPDEWIALNLFVMYMQRCSAPFTQTVSIHVVVPVKYKPSNNEASHLANFTLWSTYPCDQPLEFLATVMKEVLTTKIDPSLPFPQNHLRNVARKTCGTPWVFMVDVDIIPRPNSAQMLHEFYHSPASNCTRCQFVIPTYEMSRAAKYPESKKVLIEYERKALARQFYLKLHANSHFSTNQSLWASTNLEESPIKISHNVDIIQGKYEPFYIGPDHIPAHDERFIGFGCTRPSQVFEALETGWSFKVLTPIFVIHWGFKMNRKESRAARISGMKNKLASANTNSKARSAQLSANKILYEDFQAELKARKEISLARSKNKQDASKKFITTESKKRDASKKFITTG